MTGSKVIEFIKQNELEEAKISFGPHDKCISFGNWKVKSGKENDCITYQIIEGDDEIAGEVELFNYNDGDATASTITSEEGLKLRIPAEG